MKIKIEKDQLEEAKELADYLNSKGVKADIWGVGKESMSGHVVIKKILEIEVPEDE